MKGDIERARWLLARVDGAISHGDTKAAIVLGINGALIAAVSALNDQVVGELLMSHWVASFLGVLLCIAVLFSTVRACLVLLPSMGKGDSTGSWFFFGHIAQQSRPALQGILLEMSDLREVEELTHQIHYNSTVALRKFRNLRRALQGLVVAIGAGLLLLVIQAGRIYL